MGLAEIGRICDGAGSSRKSPTSAHTRVGGNAPGSSRYASGRAACHGGAPKGKAAPKGRFPAGERCAIIRAERRRVDENRRAPAAVELRVMLEPGSNRSRPNSPDSRRPGCRHSAGRRDCTRHRSDRHWRRSRRQRQRRPPWRRPAASAADLVAEDTAKDAADDGAGNVRTARSDAQPAPARPSNAGRAGPAPHARP